MINQLQPIKSTDKVIYDPQYYHAERHARQFNSYQSERCMETTPNNNYNGRILFAGKR